MVKRLLDRELGVSDRAYQMTHATVPVFSAAGGWTVHGKTGSGWLKKADGEADRNRPQGWFVGWAEKGDRVVAFARLRVATARSGRPSGLIARAEVLKGLAGWAGG